MKLHTREKEDETNSESLSGTKFSIQSNAEAFKILSSQLYSNKPLAIVRELSCNALDSNNAAGSKLPFKINVTPHNLIIRDYGLGLTDDQMHQVYTSYFNSTKNDSNDQVGGLGLGSKSPFSYTDRFTVTTFDGTTKRLYRAILDKGQPVLQNVNEEPAMDLRGVQVDVPLHTGDREDFVEAIKVALKYFPENSYSSAIKAEKREYYLEPDGVYALASSKGGIYFRGNNLMKLIMGPVAYTVDTSKLTRELKDKHKDLLDINGLELYMPVGSVEVAASREGLSYDKQSLHILDKAFVSISSNMGKNIQNVINKEPDYFSAQLAYGALRSSIQKVIKGTRITWQNRLLTETLVVNSLMGNAQSFAKITSDTLRRKAMKVDWSSIFKEYAFKFDNKPIIIFKDTPKGSFNKIVWHSKASLKRNTILCKGDLFDLYSLCAVFDIDPKKKATLASEHGVVNISDMPHPVVAPKINKTGQPVSRVSKSVQAIMYKNSPLLSTSVYRMYDNAQTNEFIFSELDPALHVYATTMRKDVAIENMPHKKVLLRFLDAHKQEIKSYVPDIRNTTLLFIPKSNHNVLKSNTIPEMQTYINTLLFNIAAEPLYLKVLALGTIYADPNLPIKKRQLLNWLAYVKKEALDTLIQQELLTKNAIGLLSLVNKLFEYKDVLHLYTPDTQPKSTLLTSYITGITTAMDRFQKEYPLFNGKLVSDKYSADNLLGYSDYFLAKKEVFSIQETLKDEPERRKGS